MFAHDHPDEIAGLVLVDPRWPSMTPDHLAALGAPRAGEPTTVTEVRDYLASDGFSGESVEGLAYVEAAREAAAVVAPRPGAFHAIQETHPEAVTEAIADVLGMATD